MSQSITDIWAHQHGSFHYGEISIDNNSTHKYGNPESYKVGPLTNWPPGNLNEILGT